MPIPWGSGLMPAGGGWVGVGVAALTGPGSRCNRWAKVGGRVERSWTKERGRRNHQGFSKGQAGPMVPWSSARAPVKPPRSAAAGPTREAARLRSLGLSASRPARPSAAGPIRRVLRDWERSRGRQQLVSPRGAAPPCQGTKAAARAGAPGGRAERGRGAGSGETAAGNGTPPGGAPKLPTSRTCSREGLCVLGARRAHGAAGDCHQVGGGVCVCAGGTETAGEPRARARAAAQGRGREAGGWETYCSRRTRSRRRPALPRVAWRAAAPGWGLGRGRGWRHRLQRADRHPRRRRGRRRRGCGGWRWPRRGARGRPGAQQRGARRPGAGPAGSGGSSRRSA